MKIIQFSPSITVKGALDEGERHVVAVGASTTRRMLATGFELFLAPGADGWQTRSVKITGRVLKADGTPGLAEGKTHFWLSEPDVPEWVRDLLARCLPKGPPPREPAVDAV